MNSVILPILPETILVAAAMVLFLVGVSNTVSARRATPWLALAALVGAYLALIVRSGMGEVVDPQNAVRVFAFARFVKLLTTALGMLLVLLAWPTDRDATGGNASNFGGEAGEFFGLMLLSIAGVFLVAGANDIMTLFLGIELASIPNYIMVTMSRPLPVAQEAGLKYFFLGAMAAAIMLFGFSYLYGTTGTTKLDEMTRLFAAHPSTSWQLLAAVMLIAGFAFKMAAVPLHVYAGDVYQGAATPVTAFLSYVPKASGFVALIKLLHAFGGGTYHVPHQIVTLLIWIAALTMTVGNVLALLQQNVKRILAYSSVAHTGYMLVAVAAACSTDDPEIQRSAIGGVLFYLATYALMNFSAFGVLILLASRGGRPATSAETLDDLAGSGRDHTWLALAMSASCLSLIGLPLTVGFFSKIYLIAPAVHAKLYASAAILMLNAAISAVYYLRLIGSMFLRREPAPVPGVTPRHAVRSIPVSLAVAVSAAGTVGLGIVLPATDALTQVTLATSQIAPAPAGTVAPTPAR